MQMDQNSWHTACLFTKTVIIQSKQLPYNLPIKSATIQHAWRNSCHTAWLPKQLSHSLPTKKVAIQPPCQNSCHTAYQNSCSTARLTKRLSYSLFVKSPVIRPVYKNICHTACLSKQLPYSLPSEKAVIKTAVNLPINTRCFTACLAKEL